MVIYIDENLPPPLAQALRNLLPSFLKGRYHANLSEINVMYLNDKYPEGTLDEAWLSDIDEGDCFITLDIMINKRASQKNIYTTRNLGAFFIKEHDKNGLSAIERIKNIICAFEEVLDIIKKKQKPFAYSIITKPLSVKVTEIA